MRKFKVGNLVRVESSDVLTCTPGVVPDMMNYADKVLIVEEVTPNGDYVLRTLDGTVNKWEWTDEMLKSFTTAMTNNSNWFNAQTMHGVVPYADDEEDDDTLPGNVVNLPADGHVLSENEKLFSQIVNDMFDTYVRKNHDYGDSFGKSYEEFGLVSALVRMNDKMNRLKTLSKKDAKVTDESIDDTLMDLANYSIMTVIERKKRRAKEA